MVGPNNTKGLTRTGTTTETSGSADFTAPIPKRHVLAGHWEAFTTSSSFREESMGEQRPWHQVQHINLLCIRKHSKQNSYIHNITRDAFFEDFSFRAWWCRASVFQGFVLS